MRSERPPIVCIIGRKNAGKTELTVALGAELNRRGYRVMTAKHGHGFQLDQPRRDSWRHRHEGAAARTVLASPSDFAVVGNWPKEEMPLAELVDRFLWDADIVLAEGFKFNPEPKIEVFRDAPGSEPFFDAGSDRASTTTSRTTSRTTPLTASMTLALVTDRPGMDLPIPLFDLGDPDYLTGLADFLEARFLKGGGAP